MNNSIVYRISLGLTIILSLAAFITFLGSLGTLLNGWGRESLMSLFPWKPILLVLVTSLNCSLRARLLA